MPETCPHCGARLADVGDAYCSECREELQPRIKQSVPAENSRVAEAKGAWDFLTNTTYVISLVVAAIAAVMLALPDEVAEVILLGVILASVALAVGAVIRARQRMAVSISGREKRFGILGDRSEIPPSSPRVRSCS